MKPLREVGLVVLAQRQHGGRFVDLEHLDIAAVERERRSRWRSSAQLHADRARRSVRGSGANSASVNASAAARRSASGDRASASNEARPLPQHAPIARIADANGEFGPDHLACAAPAAQIDPDPDPDADARAVCPGRSADADIDAAAAAPHGGAIGEPIEPDFGDLPRRPRAPPRDIRAIAARARPPP